MVRGLHSQADRDHAILLVTRSDSALYEQVAADLPSRPVSTYRLQLHCGFRFDDVTPIVDYLADLGISDLYLSPHLAARPGSTHGYDVFDHGRLNPEIGDEAALGRLIERVAARGMGRVLDLVPNHMGVGGKNRFWLDVLELGPSAPSARFFDIDWHPVKEQLDGRILLPVLGDQYGSVLEAGGLVLEREQGKFVVRYCELRLPLTPKSYGRVLERRTRDLTDRFDPDDPHLHEYRSIWAAAHHLPECLTGGVEQLEEHIREREVIPRRLARLCEDSPEIREFIDETIAEFQGTPGDSASFDALHRLLEEQVYRLAHWRVAAEEINYRRFFDINDLAGLRTEDPIVFALLHAQVLRWIDEGGVTGVRIDHPDGLADPASYFRALQETVFTRSCLAVDAGRYAGIGAARCSSVYSKPGTATKRSPIPLSKLARRFPIVAEKILSGSEDRCPTIGPSTERLVMST